MPEYISASDAAAKWGISKRRVTLLCKTGRIEGAFIIGTNWAVPAVAQKPTDARVKSGRYKKTLKPEEKR